MSAGRCQRALLFLALGAAEGAFSPASAVTKSSQPLQLWEHNLAGVTRYLPDNERLVAYQALKLADCVHDGQKRRDGQPFVTHPVAVARIVAEWGMDSDCVVAALLHDAVEDTPLTFGEVEQGFGKEVRALVQGVTRVSKMDPSKIAELDGVDGPLSSDGLPLPEVDWEVEEALASHAALAQCEREVVEALQQQQQQSQQAQQQRAPPAAVTMSAGGSSGDVLRLLHSCAGDWRVAVIKIADRLHNMRTLGAMAPRKRAKKAAETEAVFVPLAHYLGAHAVGSELARLSARHRHADKPPPRRWLLQLSSAVRSARSQADVHTPPAPLGPKLFFGRPRPPRSPHSSDEKRLRRLIEELDTAQPARARTLCLRLQPLHQRLARHQAVMMHGEAVTARATEGGGLAAQGCWDEGDAVLARILN